MVISSYLRIVKEKDRLSVSVDVWDCDSDQTYRSILRKFFNTCSWARILVEFDKGQNCLNPFKVLPRTTTYLTTQIFFNRLFPDLPQSCLSYL